MKKKLPKKVIKHLKGDIKTFKHEAKEDRELMKSLKKPAKKHAKKKDPKKPKTKAGKKDKMEKVMHEYKEGALHSGSKKGPQVTSRKQAIAIAMSEAGLSKKKKKKKSKK